MKERCSRLFIAVMILMSLLPANVGAKVRVAPTIEPVEEIVEGQYYYAYNTATGRFLSYNSNRYATTSSTVARTIAFWHHDGSGRYYIKFMDWNAYCLNGDGYLSGSEYYSLVQKVEGGFTFRYYSTSYNPWADAGEGTSITKSTTNNVWLLFPNSATPIQILKSRLYTALVASDNYDFDVSKYDAIYESDSATVNETYVAARELNARNALAKVIADNSTTYGDVLNKWKTVLYNTESTASQLNNAKTELDRALAFSNTLTRASSNEYPLLFTRTSPNWKVRNGYTNTATIEYNNNYRNYVNNWDYVTSYSSSSDYVQNYQYDGNYNYPTTTWDLPITVDVDVDAVFYFNYYCNGNYNNPRLTIFLDGEQQRSVYYAEGNLSRKYVIELNPGVHTVTLRCQRDYGNSSSTNFRLYDFGCRKAGDEISVNLLEAGSLGTEVLYHVDNIRQVRKLKVKGPMNDEDWQRIYMMTYLTSLDLSDAEITTIKASQVSADAHSSLLYLTRFVLPRTVKTIESKAFYKTFVGSQDFPEGLVTIGANAYQYSDVPKALLPNTVRTIGTYAFSDCAFLNEVSVPDSASVGTYAFNGNTALAEVRLADNVSVGTYAFNNCTGLKKANLPKNMVNVPAYMFYNCVALDTMGIGDKIETIGDYAFYQCYRMKMKSLPSTVKTINQYAFCNCDSLKEFTLPEGLTSVGQYAFAYSNYFHTPIPSTLKTIATHAFENAFKLDTIRIVSSANVAEQAFLNCREARTLVIGKSATIGNNAFQDCTALDSVVISEHVSLGTTPFNNCTNLRYIEFPTTYYQCTGQQLSNITGGKLRKVVFRSATMVNGSAYTSFFNGVNTDSMTIYVPSYLRNVYRLDSYWYNWPIEGFDTGEMDFYTINNPLTLNGRDRYAGCPSIEQGNNATYVKINGDSVQQFNDYQTYTRLMQLSTCDNVTINGRLSIRFYTEANKWYFLCMPYDFRVGDIYNINDAQYALRVYDGAKRATGSTGSNWRNCTADEVIPAGQGFIYQTSKIARTHFVAIDNASKQNIFCNHLLAKSLEANPSDNSAHKGWNLVGNMWRTYYNNHKLNFTAPITVWTGSTYKAYSLIDDDYAIQPAEAFFVQCPDAVDVISFPTEGRQLTSVIESQNAARGNQSASRRFLVDLVLSEDSIVDETRVVINNQASLDYEMTCDASKFMTLDTQTAQLWSVCNGVNYAINERPLDDAVVRLGFTAPHEGQYTLSLKRNQAGRVLLTDRLMGTETDLSVEDYVFSADAGTTDVRFELHFDADNVTDIAVKKQDDLKTEVYTIDGRRVGFLPANGQLPKGVYVLRRGSVTEKVRY